MTLTAVLQPLDRETLWDRAYAALKTALLAGRFAPGERIVLREVAARLNISLTPVRDAVNRLVAERALERGGGGQGGGATVPMLSADHFEQLMMIRADLEARAAASAASFIDEAAIEALQRDLDAMHRLVDAQKMDEYLELHRRFHFGIYAHARLPVIGELIENVWLRCGPMLTLVLPEYVPSVKRNEFHADALAALRRHDPQASAAAIRADIGSASTYLCGRLREREATAATSALTAA